MSTLQPRSVVIRMVPCNNIYDGWDASWIIFQLPRGVTGLVQENWVGPVNYGATSRNKGPIHISEISFNEENLSLIREICLNVLSL